MTFRKRAISFVTILLAGLANQQLLIPASPVPIPLNHNTTVEKGRSYVIDLKRMRNTREDYYARRTYIKAVRDDAEKKLMTFFEKTSKDKLKVCVLIHGFNDNHEGPWGKVHENLTATEDMVKLYIDWDTNASIKINKFIFNFGFSFITDAIENAYDIGDLLRNVIMKYPEKNGNRNISSPLFVIAHSMGSHVAETFITHHDKINLKGVIFFNPHTDHTYYCQENIIDTYFHKDKKSGFVLSFNSDYDHVLGLLSRTAQNVKRSLFYFFWPLMNQDKFISPLGISWDKFADMNKRKHRVVVRHMKLPGYKENTRFYNLFGLNHSAFKSSVAQRIANRALNVALDYKKFEIDKITWIADEEKLQNVRKESGQYPERVEYVDTTEEEGHAAEIDSDDTEIPSDNEK